MSFCVMFLVSVEGCSLGDWIWKQKKEGKPIDLSVKLEATGDGLKSNLKTLILLMIAAEAEDRLSMQEVCRQLHEINGK